MRDKFGRFIKGYPSSTSGSFKKGHKSWNKGKHYHNKPFRVEQMIDGYILIYQPSHPNAFKSGYIKRSHLVMEKYLGRYLTSKEVVHHINGIKDDDRIKNLKLCANQSAHRKYHCPWNKGRGNLLSIKCPTCGKVFQALESHHRQFCSKSCWSKSRIGSKNSFYGKRHTKKTKIKMHYSHLGHSSPRTQQLK